MTNSRLTNAQIIQFLTDNYSATGFVDGLKINYRSLICPFTDLLSLVKPGDKVGDVGCGSGQFLLLVNEFCQPGSVYGIEISDRLISNAQALFEKGNNKNFLFEQYNGADFPKQIGEMDIVFLIDVLHHVPPASQTAFLKNLALAMKPGARLVLKDINGGSPLVYFNKMHDLVFAGEIGHELKADKAKGQLLANNLKILHESKRTMYVYPHYTIVAAK